MKENFEAEIKNNGKDFLKGDSTSINIVFNIMKNNPDKNYKSFLRSQGATSGTFTLINDKGEQTINLSLF